MWNSNFLILHVVYLPFPVTILEWPANGTEEDIDKFWEMMNKAMMRKTPQPKSSDKSKDSNGDCHQNGVHNISDSVTFYNILEPSSKHMEEEVYDTVNELEMEALDKGYEKIKDTCLDTIPYTTQQATQIDEQVQHNNTTNILANGMHAKENEYINILKV